MTISPLGPTSERMNSLLLEAMLGTLERVACGTSLAECLSYLAQGVEEVLVDVRCSILLADGEGTHLRFAAGPSLPAAYNHVVDGLPVGPSSGACGTAAYRGEPVLVSDTLTDPLWEAFVNLAQEFGLVACWSYPIRAPEGAVLGTFAIYPEEPGLPGPLHVTALERAAHVAWVAIDRARQEERLKANLRSLERTTSDLHRVLDNTFDEVVVFRVEEGEFRYESANRKAQEVSGASAEEMLGKTPVDVFGLDGGSRRVAALQRCLDHGGPMKVEQLQVPGRTGPRWVDAHMIPEKDESGRIQKIMVIVRDVSERERAEAVQRATLLRLEQAVGAGDVGLWDCDLQTKEVYYSKEWKRQVGCEEHEVGEGYEEWSSRVHPEDVARANQGVEAYLAGSVPEYESEFRFRHKDGSYRRILARGNVIRDEAGVALRFVGSHVDITERAELQARLLQSQKMDLVGQLAGGIAHDFNNLLTAILGYSDLIQVSLPAEDPLKEFAAQIQRAGVLASSLTRQLLLFSSQGAVEAETLSMDEIVLGMEEMLGRLLGEDVELAVQAGSGGQLRADAGQIKQIVMNLCVNARDAMPSGGRLVVETSAVQLDERSPGLRSPVAAGSYLCLSVSDSGAGIAPAIIERVFEPFFTTKPTGRGTGLGLATVLGIVETWEGGISLSSAPGSGSTFRVYFPQVAPKAASAPGVQVAPERGAETILLVEDNDLVRNFAQSVLEGGGYTVISAEHGPQALELWEGLPLGGVQLLLTDLVMPGMSGTELAARLVEAQPGLRVLYSSGHAPEQILQERVLDAGSSFLPKPFLPGALLLEVRRVLDAT